MSSDEGSCQLFLSKILKSANLEGFSGWSPSTLSQLLVEERLITADVAREVGEEIGREMEKCDLGSLSPERVVDLLNAQFIKHGIEERIPLTKNALIVLKKRYLKRDAQGNVEETPRDLLLRVARVVAEAERIHDPQADVEAMAARFFRLMATLRFLPNSPTLMNAGRELGQLSACFVLPVEDSLDSIFEAVKNTALIHKSGGGTGFSFSRLRPQNDVVQTTKGVSSGPVSFMRVFDAATETIKQGGTRRGANMGVLSVDHPDILDFIRCKESERTLNNFNISVAVTAKFMEAVERNEQYDLVNPRSGAAVKRLPAVEVFREIVTHAYRNGEPGTIFIDRVNEHNPIPSAGPIESTNPCGEQPLLPFESCNLGSVNFAAHVRDGRINWEMLGETVHTAARFLDNVIEVNRYPLERIKEMTISNRKIGLGVMGFADMLIMLGIPYDSERALKVADEVMSFIDKESKAESARLAAARGAFNGFAESLYARAGRAPLRNATTTTVAPTGTISIIAGCSSGIEPLFAVSFVRHVLDRDELVEVHPLFERIAKERGFYSDELIREIAHRGSLNDVDAIDEDVKRLFPTALDIKPEWHVRMQAAFQAHTDNAVSKTVNFPYDASEEDVANVFRLAYKLGCKGITVYRDRSRSQQVLTTGEATTAEQQQAAQDGKLAPRERPDVVVGSTQKLVTGCGNIYVTINEDDTGPFELFTAMGKAGGCPSSQAEAISRLISLSLRAGVDINEIIKQLQGVRCPSPVWKSGEMILSCADAIARAMKRYVGSKPQASVEAKQAHKGAAAPLKGRAFTDARIFSACPECGGPVHYQESCALCYSCTFSKCG